jgi:hypothetical protein
MERSGTASAPSQTRAKEFCRTQNIVRLHFANCEAVDATATQTSDDSFSRARASRRAYLHEGLSDDRNKATMIDLARFARQPFHRGFNASVA